jgi:AraC-like DNA-binding protein
MIAEALRSLRFDIIHIGEGPLPPGLGQATQEGYPPTKLWWVGEQPVALRHAAGETALPAGAMVLVPGHWPYQPRTVDGAWLRWVTFTSRAFDCLDLMPLIGTAVVQSPADAAMRAAWDDLPAFSDLADPAGPFAADATLRRLLAPFLRRVAPRLSEQLGPVLRFRESLHYIQSHLAEPIRLEDLAARADLHPAYFSTCFARVFGIGPARFILRRRIERAQALLLQTPASIDAIAGQTGFCDGAHLGRTFRRLTGETPDAYRRAHAAAPR